MKDVLEDKVFTKTAFALRIDQLEAGIKWERQLREQKDAELQTMHRQFQELSLSLGKLSQVSMAESEEFWAVLLKYLPKEFMEKLDCVTERGKLAPTFHNGLVQALKVFGISKIGA